MEWLRLHPNAAVVFAYLVGTIAFGGYLSRFIKKGDDFFLAGRSLNQWVIAGTIMAANVAAIYLVGPAGAAYGGGGVSVLLIAWTGNMIAAASALVFVPRLRRLRITTVSELLETRYSLLLRLLVAAWWILYYALFAGNAMCTLATVLSPVLEVKWATIIWFASGGVVLYCFFAGLMASSYSAVVQSFIMIIGGLILLPLCLKHEAVGGVSGLVAKLDPKVMTFWKTGNTWPTISSVIMFTLLGLPYWCTSQYMLQCSFAGRSVRHASRGLILAAIFTGVLTLSYIIPGICGSLIYADTPLASGDSILPRLLHDVLPVGIGGLIVAGLVAASNSTASALLAASSTLAENDFFARFRKTSGNGSNLWFGRAVILVAGAIGIVFAFYARKVGIIEANFSIMSVFEPPIFVIVAGALFWRRANAIGAATAMIGGIAFGALAALVFKIPMETRTFLAFPICIELLALGSLVGEWVSPESGEKKKLVDEMLARTRGTAVAVRTPASIFGLLLAALALNAFVLCAIFEKYIPIPWNLAAFMGTMLAFVVGCYLAVPMFMPDAREGEEADLGAINDSWVQRILGSGWSWLVMGVVALALVVILYLK